MAKSSTLARSRGGEQGNLPGHHSEVVLPSRYRAWDRAMSSSFSGAMGMGESSSRGCVHPQASMGGSVCPQDLCTRQGRDAAVGLPQAPNFLPTVLAKSGRILGVSTSQIYPVSRGKNILIGKLMDIGAMSIGVTMAAYTVIPELPLIAAKPQWHRLQHRLDTSVHAQEPVLSCTACTKVCAAAATLLRLSKTARV